MGLFHNCMQYIHCFVNIWRITAYTGHGRSAAGGQGLLHQGKKAPQGMAAPAPPVRRAEGEGLHIRQGQVAQAGPAQKAEGLLAFNHPAMMLALYFCILTASWLGAQFIVGGSMTTSELTSLFSYIMSLLMSLMMLSMVVVMISMSMASIRRIDEVLRESPDLAEPEQPVTVDVRRYDMEALRNQVSVVLQKNPLFSGTILDNLRWGSPEATREECVQACRAACADEFIDRLPDGYDIYIERGTHDQLMEKKGTYYQLYTGQPARQVG